MGRRDYAQTNALLKPAAAGAAADEEIFLLLVESLTSAGDTATSFEYAQKAVNRFPSSPQVLCWMGFQLQFSGRYEEARKYLEKAVRVAPDYPASYYLLADILLKEHRFEEAVPHFQKAVEVDPNDVDARIGYGQSLASLGRFKEALVQLQEAARIAPREARVHFQLSPYFQMGDEAKAEEAARLSAKLRPPAPLITEVPRRLHGGAAALN
jgi:Flp pilus assembly protein TadD